jgi:hypothetical protein
MAEIPAEVLRDAELATLFYDTVKAKWYRRTKADGEFIFTGLSIAFRTTTKIIGDIEIALPPSVLSARKSFCVHNKGPNILYIGESGVTADSVDGSFTSGWEVLPNSYFNVDTAEAVELYGICETGKTTTIKILELS